MLIDDVAKINRSSRNAVFAALVVIVAIAMYNWVVAGHVAYLFAAFQRASVMENVVEENEVISEVVDAKKKQLEQLREQFALLQNTLFGSEAAKEFFSDLQAISEGANCTVYSLNFIEDKQSEDASGIIAKSAALSVVGEYNDVIGLVERVQARNQKVWIDELEMKVLNEGSDRLIKCDIIITIHAIQDKENMVDG